MEFTYEKESRTLKFAFFEDIDQHFADSARNQIDFEIQLTQPQKVVFDFKSVGFMDSSGIGLIIGRYKNLNLIGGSLEIENVLPQVGRILKISGIDKIVDVKEKN
jgi:stage II sporulation protein AA (anti-sigma F factor antagonist)